MTEFIDALNQKNIGHIPVWFMRQAGRYLPEYMKIKASSTFRKMSHTPEIMAEVTLQPLKRYDLDAAIMFSDILTCLEYMGSPFEFTDHGPKLSSHGPDALENLTELKVKDLSFVGDGIGLIKKELKHKPVIGFIGAPFTLASYLIEGGTSREFMSTRQFAFNNPKKFLAAMDHLSTQLSKYVHYQIESGVNAVQIFDSWGGVLGREEYQKFVFPSLERLVQNIAGKVPIILYAQPTFHLLPLFSRLEVSALSVDWRQPISEVAATLKKLGRNNVSFQGNIDPVVMTLGYNEAKPYAEMILKDVKKAGIRDRFIFNVGHGFTPKTNTETVGEVVKLVHSFD
jgi:uroporphyrinogen decarboxylase